MQEVNMKIGVQESNLVTKVDDSLCGTDLCYMYWRFKMLQFFYTQRLMEFREGLKRVLLVWQNLTTCRQTPARPWEGRAGAVHCVLNEEKRLAERAVFMPEL
jgi:hypothetical protein